MKLCDFFQHSKKMERKRVRAKPPQEYRSDPAGEEVWRGKGDVTFVRRSRRIALAKRIRTSKVYGITGGYLGKRAWRFMPPCHSKLDLQHY